ncbi:hypothetical protein [Williamsia serinedens]|uniref:Uncharacterized protein n=1 Tax=Williamsia serinedens TaxID=391736 RepID=A0ABT1H682_9NOCA|nr:hypothetical protein [Williamsia serinedens]MCP2162661.1 hypothetical protein [Williamsia serinedens]
MTVRIVDTPDALYELRRDPALVAVEQAEAQKIADRANAQGKGTYAVGSRQGIRDPQGRWRTNVSTADAYAMRANAKYNILIKAMSE